MSDVQITAAELPSWQTMFHAFHDCKLPDKPCTKCCCWVCDTNVHLCKNWNNHKNCNPDNEEWKRKRNRMKGKQNMNTVCDANSAFEPPSKWKKVDQYIVLDDDEEKVPVSDETHDYSASFTALLMAKQKTSSDFILLDTLTGKKAVNTTKQDTIWLKEPSELMSEIALNAQKLDENLLLTNSKKHCQVCSSSNPNIAKDHHLKTSAHKNQLLHEFAKHLQLDLEVRSVQELVSQVRNKL